MFSYYVYYLYYCLYFFPLLVWVDSVLCKLCLTLNLIMTSSDLILKRHRHLYADNTLHTLC